MIISELLCVPINQIKVIILFSEKDYLARFPPALDNSASLMQVFTSLSFHIIFCVFTIEYVNFYQDCSFNPLSDNPKKWSNTLKQLIGSLPANYLSVFDHFVGLALKVLMKIILRRVCRKCLQ